MVTLTVFIVIFLYDTYSILAIFIATSRPDILLNGANVASLQLQLWTKLNAYTQSLPI